jgi:hypothetical protein
MSEQIEVPVETRMPWNVTRNYGGEVTDYGTIWADDADKARAEFLSRFDDEEKIEVDGRQTTERELMTVGLTVKEPVKSRRKDQHGIEFVVEDVQTEEREFDMDAADSHTMVAAHCDWLEEQGCRLQAELLRLDWGVRIGHVPRSKSVVDRIAKLRKYFEIKDSKLVPQQVDGQRGRKQTITLFLQEPLGHYYTKATVNLLHLSNEVFQAVLHNNPIMDLCIACNATSAPGLVVKYLNYQWFKKVEKLELNNLEVPFVQLREMFRGSPLRLRELRITGRQKTLPSIQQLQLLPSLVKEFSDLWTIDYHGVKYDYRFDESNQPK